MCYGLCDFGLFGVVIFNVICFSVDGGILYYCDLVWLELWCCDYDVDSVCCCYLCCFVLLELLYWEFDGVIIDVEGGFWNV